MGSFDSCYPLKKSLVKLYRFLKGGLGIDAEVGLVLHKLKDSGWHDSTQIAK